LSLKRAVEETVQTKNNNFFFYFLLLFSSSCRYKSTLSEEEHSNITSRTCHPIITIKNESEGKAAGYKTIDNNI
jgi:hypothetical protein